MDCPICFNSYDFDKRKPTIILNCSHTLCLECAEKCVICPLDRQPIVDRKPNYAMIEYMTGSLAQVQNLTLRNQEVEAKYNSLITQFGLEEEDDEENKQLIKFIATASIIKDLPMNQRFAKMPNLIKEMARDLKNLRKICIKELNDVGEIMSVINDFINQFEEAVNGLSNEFGVAKNNLTDIKNDILKYANSESAMNIFLPSIKEKCQKHLEKMDEIMLQSEIKQNEYKKVIESLRETLEAKKLTTEKRLKLNEGLKKFLPGSGLVAGAVVAGGGIGLLVGAEAFGGVGALVIAGAVLNPIGAIILGALGTGVAIGTLVYIVLRVMKSKNEKILKMLESYLSKLTQLSDSSNGFFEAVKEVYSKLSSHDLTTHMDAKNLSLVVSLIDFSLQTIGEFQTRRDQNEFRVSEIMSLLTNDFILIDD
jgi:hypothetical protein